MTKSEIDEMLGIVGLKEGQILVIQKHFERNKLYCEHRKLGNKFNIFNGVVGVLKIHETNMSERKYENLGTHTITFQRFVTNTMEINKKGSGIRFKGKTKEELHNWLDKFKPATEEVLDHVYFIRTKKVDESKIQNAIRNLERICTEANLKYSVYVEGFSDGGNGIDKD